MLKVYVSSTFSDLEAVRARAIRQIRKSGHTVISMETYNAGRRRPTERCVADVGDCDVYVGIFAYRYGYVPRENNPKDLSITEMEYFAAKESGKEILIFIAGDSWPIEGSDFTTGEGKRGTQILDLRKPLEADHSVAFFGNAAELAAEISPALEEVAKLLEAHGQTSSSMQDEVEREPAAQPPPTGSRRPYPLSMTTFDSLGRRAAGIGCLIGPQGPMATTFSVDSDQFGLPNAPVGQRTFMTAYYALNSKGEHTSPPWQACSVAFGRSRGVEGRVTRIIFESSGFGRSGCGVSVFEVDTENSDVELLPVTFRLPSPDSAAPVFVIGYRFGEAEWSIMPGELIDHEGPPDGTPEYPERIRLHYSCDTAPGVGGAPVLDQFGNCIAVHYARMDLDPVHGRPGLRRLDGGDGRYSASEGVWLGSVKEAVKRSYSRPKKEGLK